MAADDDVLRCPISGTQSDMEQFELAAGYYYDGGFHHCTCGAVVEWTGKPSEGGLIVTHEDFRLVQAVHRLKAMPLKQVLVLLIDDNLS